MTEIPTQQLNRWQNQGATESPQQARNRINNILHSDRSPLTEKKDKFKVRLQGSYKNYTTTHGSSDVDILIRLTSAWHYDLSELPPDQERLYNRHHSPAKYGWDELRDDVITALKVRRVPFEEGEKAITIDSDESTLGFGADLVVCIDFRKYHEYTGYGDDEHSYTTGIAFDTNTLLSRTIINFPDQHYKQGNYKSNNTNSKYRPVVRMFKNARNRMVQKGLIEKETAPSYFIACLLYNVPDHLFDQAPRDQYLDIVNWLVEHQSEWVTFESQNGILPLFKESNCPTWFDERDLWTVNDCELFVGGLARLWNNWGDL